MGRAQRRIRVLVADDHPSVRENLRYLLNAEADLEVVAAARDGASAVRLARELRPDVIVVDYDLPDLDGLTVARILRREGRKARIVLYTMNREVCAWAHRSGVDVCVSKDDPPTALIEAVRSRLQSPARKGTHVLVVEDDAETRLLMRMALEEEGLETVTTGDGFEALAECERRTPGVVVLDLGLPAMSGRDFVTAYRRMPSHEAPIVVVSAGHDARQIAADLGAAAFVPKPFSIAELTQAIRHARLTQPAPPT